MSANHINILQSLMQQRILVLDGAMGTMLQQKNLSADDFGGANLEGCNENLVLTRPKIIEGIHNAYFEAGSDIIETNTFGATPLVLAEYGLEDKVDLINKKAVQIAQKAAQKFSTPQKPRFVAGAMGPTTKAISVTGGITFEQLVTNFYKQALALIEAGCDLLLLETAQDTRNVKAGVIGIHQAFQKLNIKLPLMVSGTIEPMGTMLAGQAADAFVASLHHVDLLSIGLNCATGPELMTDHIRTIHELANCGVSCYPNAGLPDEEGKYLETPQSLAKQIERFVNNGWINIIGGCCGTTDKHIAAIANMVKGKKPRTLTTKTKGRSFYSGIELVEATPDNRPLLVGERTNVIGSQLFKRLVSEEKWDEATDIAKRQTKNGAQIIDVCLQSTDRDELPDVDPFYSQLIKKIKAPLMIDTTDPVALEKALTYCQGKSIINSINLEDGEEKFKKVCPLIKKYGAAVVVGMIDEDPHQAQAFTRERKLEVAKRSHKLLTEKYGIKEEDIIFDPLVFPCASGDANYIGGAVETIEGIRLIKKQFPNCKTILGISNVSFGLQPAAREVINSVFLYHGTQAGLDLAIVNAEKLERFATISEEEKRLAENLLFNCSSLPPLYPPYKGGNNQGPPLLYKEGSGEVVGANNHSPLQMTKINQENIAKITEFYRGVVKKRSSVGAYCPMGSLRDNTPLLANYIIEGSKDGLISDLDLKLKEGAKPLDIINGPLMQGMAEVGRLFNKNELIVAEVLQSAEVMKAAVSHLEQFMKKEDIVSRGKVLLATVKGDVHDIGKNLVEIILQNNGYEVINLGIKIPSEEIIAAAKKYNPNMIGLSGLLVKSAQQMTITVNDLKVAGIQIPILVGGAALSDKFTRTKIAPSYNHVVLYAKDAMTGLDLANKLMDPKTRDELIQKHSQNDDVPLVGAYCNTPLQNKTQQTTHRNPNIRLDLSLPPVPYQERKKRDIPDLEKIWSYINPQMLYTKHLGFRGNFEKKLASRDIKALKLKKQVDQVKKQAKKFMKAKAVWQFFEAEVKGNSILLFKKGGNKPLHIFHFKRQPKNHGLCLADYILPAQIQKKKKVRDHIVLFVVSAGYKIKEKADEFKNKGDYLYSHALQALALETAEACAEWLHRRIREDWGFPDSKKMTMKDRFQAKYRGKRYSFGYPACPDLEDQKGIWKLLKPQDIGISLTEGMMMEPEASVSALVFHHPDCIYFGVGQEEQKNDG